ncbi:hypothetical protein J7J47_11870 [Halomonas sp. ISL-60]|uniref:hypothetical protein n=1 Tax=Halomonas sp. ISL-56 TaxID=2819149 RepID=UPI001BEC0A70|nr:hypothetical protein [Halomonas sp. ISL-56]MBT2772920.1 hypothetical protein [Halomonas sp. ISL-60]MBT2799967.1 hypothetical protein [Halomonas sp. ISL-56]
MSFEQAVVNLEQTNAKLQEEVVRFRDAAMGLNNIYPTITEGRQNTDDGKYFSVPGSGAYMRLYRRQGTSAELIAEFPDRDTVLDIQQGVSAFTDRGIVGADGPFFSLASEGTSPQVTDDIYQSRPSGTYYSLGALNSPAAVNGHLLWCKYSISGLYDKALFLPQNVANRLFILGQHNGAFQQPVEVYTTGNLLGPVSQSGGVPTGSVIERGSNSDGEYVKFADGTMICTLHSSLGRTINIDTQISGDFYRSGATGNTWTYPRQFVSEPICYAQIRTSIDQFGVTKIANASDCLIGGISLAGSRTNQTYTASAIGRWY